MDILYNFVIKLLELFFDQERFERLTRFFVHCSRIFVIIVKNEDKSHSLMLI